MADLKENIDNEVAAAREEFLKLDSHITGYINEMDKVI
jgi:kinetochore protein Nuf2